MKCVFLTRDSTVVILEAVDAAPYFESRDGRTFYRSAFDCDAEEQLAFYEQIPAGLDMIARKAGQRGAVDSEAGVP